MLNFRRLDKSGIEFNQTDRNTTLVRADELRDTGVLHNNIKDGPQVPPTGFVPFDLGPNSKRVVLHNITLKGDGFDGLARGGNAEHLVPKGCTIDVAGTPPQQQRRITFPPAAPSVPSLEQQRRSGKLVGRNEPCPCESGKKYKRCHGMLK